MTYILSIALEEMTGLPKGITAANDCTYKYILYKDTCGSVRASY